MAATVSSPWGKPGAWALDAEEHEDELQQTVQEQKKDDSGQNSAEFPSLAAAAADAKQSKKKKKKTNIPLSLYSPGGITDADFHSPHLSLPKGPRQRTDEELERLPTGGFRSYGMSYRNGDDSSNSRWGGAGGNNSRSYNNREASREPPPPSRADEIDDWSKTKKSTVVTGNGYERRERERGSSFFESHSKADEADSWVANKPTEQKRFGSGFERRGSFDSLSRDRHVSSNGGAADSDNWGRKREESNGTGTVSARPKLVLQPRTVSVSNGNETVAKPKGSSPFGDARPREEVLAEKGKDWKEIDEKLESMKINNKNEEEKGERGNSGSRWSFGRGRSGERAERGWKKPDAVDTGSRPQRFAS